jgi:hypothetical protein
VRIGEDLSEVDAYALMKYGAKQVLLQCSDTENREKNLFIANDSIQKKL